MSVSVVFSDRKTKSADVSAKWAYEKQYKPLSLWSWTSDTKRKDQIGISIPYKVEFAGVPSLNAPTELKYEFSLGAVLGREAELLKRNNEKLSYISHLSKGWNGYNADPIPSSVVKHMERILKGICKQPDIFPTADDSIQFEYEKSDGSYLEFEVREDGISVFEVREGHEEVQHSSATLSLDSINSIVRSFMEEYEA